MLHQEVFTCVRQLRTCWWHSPAFLRSETVNSIHVCDYFSILVASVLNNLCFLPAESINIPGFLEQDEACVYVVDMLNTLTSPKGDLFTFFFFEHVINTTLK